MSAAPPAELLAHLQSGLETLLSNLDGGAWPEPAALDSAWNELELRFAALEARMQALELPDDELVQLAERARHCLRLQAVARTLLAQYRADVVRERDACAGARARLRRIRAAGPSGGPSGASCDVAG